MPLFIVLVAYNVVQKSSANPDQVPPQELDPILEPIWAQYSLVAQNPLE
jgi:hypothetical protein